MAELPKDLSNRELLARIVQLESQAARVEEQQAEIEFLKAKIADLHEALMSEVTNTTQHINSFSDHFKSTYQYLADIHDHLWPLVYKVFPGAADARRQIDAFVQRRGKSDGEMKDR